MTLTIDLPQEITFNEGDNFTVYVEGVVRDGKLVVERMRTHFEKPISAEERAKAIEGFLSRRTGPPCTLTDKQIDDLRWEAIKEKHGL